MPLAVDSSVLFSLFKSEPSSEGWLDLLIDLGRHERLVVCDVVVAEGAPFFEDAQTLLSALSDLNLEYDPIDSDTAFLAGEIFAEYRRQGGTRTSMIPDFMIGAHGLGQADGLLATDRGYIRRFFRGLKIIRPANT